MNIIERIIQIAEYKEISTNKFSQLIGVSNAYFTKQKKNNANVGSQIIEKIVSSYPEISLHWLITGEGDMLNRQIENGGEKTDMKLNNNNNDIGNSILMTFLKEKDIRIEELKEEIGRLKSELDYFKKKRATIAYHVAAEP